jgi:hypothetical protein
MEASISAAFALATRHSLRERGGMRLPVALLVALIAATGAAAEPDVANHPLLEDYARSAVGRFSSAAQHRTNPAYDEVTAHVVRLWPERADEVWLYQEQTIRSGPQASSRPYFQRIGRVRLAGDGTLRRDNLTLKDPLRFAGYGTPGYRGPAITADDLGPAGCHNVLSFVAPGDWTARTEDCANSYRGATKMESRAIIAGDRFVNWDRGFDAAGRQVWGPKGGGYVFDRLP